MSSAFSRFHACKRRSQYIQLINFIFTILWILDRLFFNGLLLLSIYNSKLDSDRLRTVNPLLSTGIYIYIYMHREMKFPIDLEPGG